MLIPCSFTAWIWCHSRALEYPSFPQCHVMAVCKILITEEISFSPAPYIHSSALIWSRHMIRGNGRSVAFAWNCIELFVFIFSMTSGYIDIASRRLLVPSVTFSCSCMTMTHFYNLCIFFLFFYLVEPYLFMLLVNFNSQPLVPYHTTRGGWQLAHTSSEIRDTTACEHTLRGKRSLPSSAYRSL